MVHEIPRFSRSLQFYPRRYPQKPLSYTSDFTKRFGAAFSSREEVVVALRSVRRSVTAGCPLATKLVRLHADLGK